MELEESPRRVDSPNPPTPSRCCMSKLKMTELIKNRRRGLHCICVAGAVFLAVISNQSRPAKLTLSILFVQPKISLECRVAPGYNSA